MANSKKNKQKDITTEKLEFVLEKKFQDFYEEFSPRIFNYIAVFFRNSTLAEDLTQEVFLRLYQQMIAQPPNEESISSWLFAVARNICIDWLKKNSNRYESPSEPGYMHGIKDQSLGIVEKIEIKEIQNKIEDIVAKLPPMEREVFILRNMEKMKYKEIALVVDTSERNVKRQMKSALQRIAFHLNQAGLGLD